MENDHISAAPQATRRPPWNKGKLIGAKPPLRPSHVWSIVRIRRRPPCAVGLTPSHIHSRMTRRKGDEQAGRDHHWA
jgi:hypothetical protein